MDAPDNKRQTPRYPYPYYQQVAAVQAGQMPALTGFRRVLCADLSSGGIALFLADAPESDEWVVALGKPPNLTYMCASVTHVQETEHKGQMRYRVGCRFAGRAAVDETTSTLTRTTGTDAAENESETPTAVEPTTEADSAVLGNVTPKQLDEIAETLARRTSS